MSAERFLHALDDTRFHGQERLAWLCFADNSGSVNLASVRKWANVTTTDAMQIIMRFVEMGLVVEGRYGLVCPELQDAHKRLGPRFEEVSLDTRKAVFERDGGRCRYCGTTDGPFELDHVMPRSRGGDNSQENLVVSCGPCNRRKKARTPEEMGWTLR